MRLYAVTLFRGRTDPLTARVHRYVKSHAEAVLDAQIARPIGGYLACATSVDVGPPASAVLRLANDPDWLRDRPRKVIWPLDGRYDVP